MFYDEAMQELRKTHDCSDLDISGLLPVFAFNVFRRDGDTWKQIEGEFYADTPLEAIDQARSGVCRNSFLKAECVKACNYFIDGEGAHIILDNNTCKLLKKSAYLKRDKNDFPCLDEFIAKTLKRREEMKAEGLL